MKFTDLVIWIFVLYAVYYTIIGIGDIVVKRKIKTTQSGDEETYEVSNNNEVASVVENESDYIDEHTGGSYTQKKNS
jgi:hypothetical protein